MNRNSKKTNKSNRPPLSFIDKCIYLLAVVLTIAGSVIVLFCFEAIQRLIAFADPTVIADVESAVFLFALPLLLFIDGSAIIFFMGRYRNKIPFLGNAKVKYGQHPWDKDCYPLFDKRRKAIEKPPSEKKLCRKKFILWMTCFLLFLMIAPLSLFGRDCLHNDYHISSYNSSGFTGSQAKDKYLAAMQEEAKEADKAQAANAPKKKHSLEVFKFGDHDNPLKIDVEIPQSGWSVSDKGSGIKLVDNEDPDAFGAGFIQFSTKDKVEDFDFYKDKFENYKELGTREISGITFQARSYKNIGYDWIEYIAQIDDETALSVGTVRVDVDEGTTGDIILKSIAIK